MVAKSFPSLRGEGNKIFSENHTKLKNIKNETFIYVMIFAKQLHQILLIVSVIQVCVSNINFTRRHPEPRIPPDSRSVQILYRISGMLNESHHSHIGDVRFRIHYIGTNGNRKCQANFL